MKPGKSAREKTVYCCQSCGFSSPKWLGKCGGCGEWNTLVEERQGSSDEGQLATLRSEFETVRSRKTRAEAAAGAALSDWDDPDWVRLSDATETQAIEKRVSTGIGELDRVLGGGLVPDSLVLIGGDPGIGKSTLLLQMARGLASKGLKVFYISGEESVSQIRGRANRLGVESSHEIYLAAETQLERVFASIKEIGPDVVIMDSLQTFATAHLDSAPGSVSQVRDVTARLMTFSKSAGIATFLVGHVTKDGGIAGPKVVEHMVDTVLYFEGDGGLNYRLLRTVKNRFGSTRELGVFEMNSQGLVEVKNPSALFLTERSEKITGTAVLAAMEGSRSLLIEIQALVAPSPLSMPRRTSVGMDPSRVALIAAILERHLRINLAQQDLYFNVAGGMRLGEPAADLAAAAAIWSSAEGDFLPQDTVFIGELCLTGEVRRVSLPEPRLIEAQKLGFKRAVVPAQIKPSSTEAHKIELVPISRIQDLPGLVKKL